MCDLFALAGRVGKAYFAETAGEYRPDWTIEQVASDQAAIGSRDNAQVFQPVPSGFYDHLGFSFGMRNAG